MAQDRQALHAAAFHAQRDAVVLLDADLAVLDDNGVLHEWLGAREEGDLLARVHPADVEVLGRAAAEAAACAPGWTPEAVLRVRHSDGGTRRLAIAMSDRRADPQLAGIVLQARDVTGQPPFAALAEVDARLAEVLAAAPVSIFTLDLEGIVRFAAGGSLWMPPEQLVGRSLMTPRATPEQVARIRRALTGEEVTAVSDWGGRYWQASYRPLRTDGVLTGVVALFADITVWIRAEQARAAGEAHLTTVIETADEAIIVLDAEGRISSANASCTRLFGVAVRPGTRLRNLLDPPTAALLEGKRGRRAAGERERYELAVRDVRGEQLWLRVSASPMLAKDGAYLGSVAVLTDITENKQVEQRLEAAARTDPVTGVSSRATLADRIEHALGRRSPGVVAILFCDVDELKATNDRLGHAAGDELLRQVAARIASTLRPADTLARYGGDEFVVVCEELHAAEEAAGLAERIRLAVARPLDVAGARITPTISVGVASAPPHRPPAELLAAADAAAYAAKRAGRNAVRLAP